jgi:hypothetical protein
MSPPRSVTVAGVASAAKEPGDFLAFKRDRFQLLNNATQLKKERDI